MDAVDGGSVPVRVQVFAHALQKKYGSQCQTLEDKHLDQAIEQEVLATYTKSYFSAVVLHAVVCSKASVVHNVAGSALPQDGRTL